METQVDAPVPAAPTNGASEQAVSREPGERIRASPLVRRIAAEHDIDLSGVTGSGPHGRIVKRDIEPLMTGAQPRPAAAPQPAAQPEPEQAQPERAPERELAPAAAAPSAGGQRQGSTRIRQTIGKRMSQSFQQAPHFYVSSKIEMVKALALRKQVNGDLDEATQVSVNDLIVKATAMALRKFPVLNSSFVEGRWSCIPTSTWVSRWPSTADSSRPSSRRPTDNR